MTQKRVMHGAPVFLVGEQCTRCVVVPAAGGEPSLLSRFHKGVV